MQSIKWCDRGRGRLSQAAAARANNANDKEQVARAPAWLAVTTMGLITVFAVNIAGWASQMWFVRWEELLAETTLVSFAYWVGRQVATHRARTNPKAAAVASSRWLTVPASAFPTLLMVVAFRAVVIEPFAIPSESMEPTLLVGDQIIVDKFAYALKVPVLDLTVATTGQPKRGDVVVFRSPVDPKADWIKRVVGLPGDVVLYKQQRLFVNGKSELEEDLPATVVESTLRVTTGDVTHQIQLNPQLQTDYTDRRGSFPLSEACDMTASSMQCVVPPGHYFLMGDNRDHSEDSRRWGFLPAANLVGRASYIWASKHSGERAGKIH